MGEDTAVTPDPPARPRPGSGPGRRSVLAAAALAAAGLPALLSACQGVQVLGKPPPPPGDVIMLHAAIAAERAMLARCAAAIAPLSAAGAEGRAAATAVRGVQAEHTAHLAQLHGRLAGPSPSPAPSRAPAPAGSPAAGGSVTAMLAALEQAEQAASDRLIGQLRGLPPDLAQLFASIAAAEAAHVPYLRRSRGAA